MVDGIHGPKDHAARLVVVEQNNLLDHVAILLLPVEVYPVQAIVHMKKNAINFVVVVRLYYMPTGQNLHGEGVCRAGHQYTVVNVCGASTFATSIHKRLIRKQ